MHDLLIIFDLLSLNNIFNSFVFRAVTLLMQNEDFENYLIHTIAKL